MDKEYLLKRLRYRSGHRGCKETDVVFAQFCETRLEGLQGPLLAAYEQLLDEDDADIWNWLVGRDTPENKEYQILITMLREYSPS
jgi:antitoxin CptB